MNLTCPKCKETFTASDDVTEGYDFLRCPFCEHRIPIPRKKQKRNPFVIPVWIISLCIFIFALCSLLETTTTMIERYKIAKATEEFVKFCIEAMEKLIGITPKIPNFDFPK